MVKNDAHKLGFYWVKVYPNHNDYELTVGEFVGGKDDRWYVCGEEIPYYEGEMLQVIEFISSPREFSLQEVKNG